MFLAFLFLGSFAFSAVAGDYTRDALRFHNEYRRIHSVPHLRLNSQLSAGAAAYARTFMRLGKIKHSDQSTRPDIGESLIYWCKSEGDPLPARESVKKMYDEVCLYDFAKPGYSLATSHFSQMVWKGTTELGVGTAKGTKDCMNCLYVVYRYKKIGNIKNKCYFKKNVLQGSFKKSYCKTIKNTG